MTLQPLQDFIRETAEDLHIPGVAVGVWASGKEVYACHGVTSLENPLPVTPDTLFLIGSITKTFTATTLMCLAADNRVALDAPVRQYLPDFNLADESAAEAVSLSNLLNHTSGMDFGLIHDTGEGDDALERYVTRLPDLRLIAPVGTRVSYSQAGYNALGRVIERVTGKSYEQAVSEWVLMPLGLQHSFYSRDDIMTRRYSVGHNRANDGTLGIARMWRRARGDNPGGGLASSVADQLRWARFHRSKGREPGIASPILAELISRMQQPTMILRASNLGDAVGLGWFLKEIDGAQAVCHGGSANGQFADLLFLRDMDLAVVTLANAFPEGIRFNQAVTRWALKTFAGITDRDPEPLPFDPMSGAAYMGHYENEVMTLTIDADGSAWRLEVLMKAEIRAASDKPLPPDHAPFAFGLLPGKPDEYIILTGAFKGQRGYFTRDSEGRVQGVDLAGRLFRRSRLPIEPDGA